MFDSDRFTSEELLSQADTACYAANLKVLRTIGVDYLQRHFKWYTGSRYIRPDGA